MRLLIVLVIGFALYLLQGLFFKKNWLKGLNAKIEFEDAIMREGDRNALVEIISNDKALILPVLQLKFSLTRTFVFPKEKNSAVTDLYYRSDYFTCRPYQIITRKYYFTATKRGEYKISTIDLICKDIFVNKSNFATSDKLASVLVLPGRIKEENIPDNIVRFTGDVVRRIKLNEDPFEFNSIREYQPYDSMNHINWKATAKNDSLQVNTFNTTDRKNVVILLNMDMNILRNKENLEEGSIKIASCLCERFISKQIPTALYSNGLDYDTNEMIEVEPGADEGHIRNIDIALARISIKDIYPSFINLMDKFVNKESNDEYIIISNYRREDLCLKIRELKDASVNVRLIIPEFARSAITPFEENGYDIFKWVIDNEK